MNTITIGTTAAGETVALRLSKAARHGLVTGSTGTGKTVTLQKLAEQFSAAGIPVFLADIKGDLSGISAGRPATFWDLFGVDGHKIRTSVQEMGPDLLAQMLGLNEAQSGSLAICFQKAQDDRKFLLTLDDLRWTLQEMSDAREEISARYGNVTSVSLAAIRRAIFVLESQGGHQLFGEPPFDIRDFMRINVPVEGNPGKGVINILSADRLIECPKLYAIFLLWLMRELFKALPEVGDVNEPRMVFFFDEAHLLFRDAPKPLLLEIERLVRLIRSKGVGIFFVTQSPADIPDSVLAQLGNRIQHCLRAYTRKDQAMVRAAADAFRQDKTLDVRKVVTELGTGEAIVSVLDDAGIPTFAKRVMVEMPVTTVGPISKSERDVTISFDPLFAKYSTKDSVERQYAIFQNRMLVARGIEIIPVNDQDWKEGDYLAFVPKIPALRVSSGPSRLFLLRKLAVWTSFTAAAVFALYQLT